MYDISIIMPAIRVPRWDSMYDSITRSCKKYSFELIICGPFQLTEKLKNLSNVKSIIDYGSPSRCAQIAALAASSNLIAHLVDDAIFLENSMDEAIDLYKSQCTRKDVVNLRYTEGHSHNGDPRVFGPQYFKVSGHPFYRLPGIPQHLDIAPHHIINLEYFKDMGGYDCINFEYQNHNLTDLMFRIQTDGGKIYHSQNIVTHCDWILSGEHKPIEDAFNMNDTPNFYKIYNHPDALNLRRNSVSIDNWKETPTIWKRRFRENLPNSFEDLKY